MTVARRLAEWTSSIQIDAVPDAVRLRATRHLVDGMGTALAARRDRVVEPAVAVAAQLGGRPEATVFGSRQSLSAPAAAFANGALTHALDFDDTHAGGLVHATAVVLPAAFALGEQTHASGAEVLAAAIAGYETVCRIAMASPHGFHARGLHATQVAGVFSAAAVTARLLGFDAATTTAALGIAGSSAGGLLEFLSTGASTKQLHPGSASLNGVLAARLAAEGASGPDSVLDGPHGIYAALSARPVDLDVICASLGTSWEVTKITIKPYPACQLMHVALDATVEVLATGRVRVDAIDHVVVDVHPDSASVVCEPVEVKVRPRTVYDAKFSLPWSVAALLVDGAIDKDTYTPISIMRPEVAELAARVHSRIVRSPGVAADAPGRVEITLRDGLQRSGAVERSSGGPGSPLSDHALREKFLANTGAGPSACELFDRVSDLTAESDLTVVIGLAARVVEEQS